ncbi:hypothetical protein NDU88_005447 [Pleurodeles waltl]|uniref:Uncharacterized protein n=1 Tax=Pleurodeles waltl TaxID=8319 RepID=A0AAV7MAJ7_PLEWA|nr:hypothetical protein NDU88_005447 [Pleurodeles waltl]
MQSGAAELMYSQWHRGRVRGNLFSPDMWRPSGSLRRVRRAAHRSAASRIHTDTGAVELRPPRYQTPVQSWVEATAKPRWAYRCAGPPAVRTRELAGAGGSRLRCQILTQQSCKGEKTPNIWENPQKQEVLKKN